MSQDPASKHRKAEAQTRRRRRQLTMGAIAALLCVGGATVIVKQRLEAQAHERARQDALRTLEQAMKDGKKAQLELEAAIERRNQEQKRYIDTNHGTHEDVVENKALKAGEPPAPPVDRSAPTPGD